MKKIQMMKIHNRHHTAKNGQVDLDIYRNSDPHFRVYIKFFTAFSAILNSFSAI